MQKHLLGPLGQVSRLTLGGGGIGIGWGPTTQDEASATIRAAVDGGIDLIDTAPMYNQCEAIVGETFGGRPPAHLRFTTKCALGSPKPEEVEAKLRGSLESSLRTMRLEQVAVFFLHTNIRPDDYVYAIRPDLQGTFSTTWSLYENHFIPAMERLKTEGKIATWGITGIGIPDTISRALAAAKPPGVIQAVTNLLDSAGSLRRFAEPANPRAIIRQAKERGIGVMGIRAVQAGALTVAIDRHVSPNNPDSKDYERAAPYRALCRELGEDPALLAHRYALSIDGVGTVVLGVKNRAELEQCLEAERLGPLEPALLQRIDSLALRQV
jgi:aryl-alcohol dehydrogenase-like predicted oxidoreductase